jgi:hypothetical protein
MPRRDRIDYAHALHVHLDPGQARSCRSAPGSFVDGRRRGHYLVGVSSIAREDRRCNTSSEGLVEGVKPHEFFERIPKLNH